MKNTTSNRQSAGISRVIISNTKSVTFPVSVKQSGAKREYFASMHQALKRAKAILAGAS